MNTKSISAAMAWLVIQVASLSAQTSLTVEGIPPDSPLTIAASATGTHLVVDISLEPEWHVYARDVGGGQPVTLTMSAASGYMAISNPQLPPSPTGKLTGEVRIRLPIGVTQAATDRTVSASLQLQVCDALICLPPMTVKLEGAIPQLKLLLVVGAQGERSDRIVDWLRERDFEVELTTYDEVTEAMCLASDVVLADSQVFGKTDANRAIVQQFPKTETPLIAIGFNGTELVEAHQIAMTSGYI